MNQSDSFRYQTYPLFAYKHSRQTVATMHNSTVGQPELINAGKFWQDILSVARQLPDDVAILNNCQNRYHFAVGFLACVYRGLITLMPPIVSPGLLDPLQQTYSQILLLSDVNADPAAQYLPHVLIDWNNISANSLPKPDEVWDVPSISAEQIAAIAFTSGSTGQPEPQVKKWGGLVRNAQMQYARVLETLSETKAAYSEVLHLLATVPVQHMYGFESSLLLALHSGGSFDAKKLFFPADIVQSLVPSLYQDNSQPTEQAPTTVLVSTPLHLNALCQALDETTLTLARAPGLVFSATSPLQIALAHKIESTLHAPLLEIYGCTESGQLATRKSTQTLVWQTYAGSLVFEKKVILNEQEHTVFGARGEHFEGEAILADILQIEDAQHFTLLGRSSDMINIAGKRNSLAYLNQVLLSINGIEDGVFYFPEPDKKSDSVQRLVAFVQAPSLTTKQIAQALRQHIDAVFMPRKIWLVKALPRNHTGKLPRQALHELYLQLNKSRTEI